MFVEIFITVSIDILGIMNRKVYSTLEDEDVVLVSKGQDYCVDEVAQQQAEKDVTASVDEVPLTAIAFVDF